MKTHRVLLSFLFIFFTASLAHAEEKLECIKDETTGKFDLKIKAVIETNYSSDPEDAPSSDMWYDELLDAPSSFKDQKKLNTALGICNKYTKGWKTRPCKVDGINTKCPYNNSLNVSLTHVTFTTMNGGRDVSVWVTIANYIQKQFQYLAIKN